VFAGGTPTISLGTRAAPAALFVANGTPVTTLGRNVIAFVAGAAQFFDVDTELVAVIAGTPTSGVLDVEFEYTVPDETP
jgi:hypothetical protein